MRSSRGRRSYLAGFTRSPVHTRELTSKQEQARIAEPTLWGYFGLISTTPGISMAPYYSTQRPPAHTGGLSNNPQPVELFRRRARRRGCKRRLGLDRDKLDL